MRERHDAVLLRAARSQSPLERVINASFLLPCGDKRGRSQSPLERVINASCPRAMEGVNAGSQSPLERVINASHWDADGNHQSAVSIPFRTGHQCEHERRRWSLQRVSSQSPLERVINASPLSLSLSRRIGSQSPLERVINASILRNVARMASDVSIPFRTGHQCEQDLSPWRNGPCRLNPL